MGAGQFVTALLFPRSGKCPFLHNYFHKCAGPVRFFKLSEEAIESGNARILSDVKRLLRQPAGKTQYGYVYGGLLEEGYPTSFDYYSEETERLRQEVGELGERVRLAQVADILGGYRPLQPGKEYGKGASDFLAISATEITADGRVDLSNVKTITKPADVQHFLKDGDLCIRQIDLAPLNKSDR